VAAWSRSTSGDGLSQELGRASVGAIAEVERHLSNIFTKIDVTSRSAATGFAFAHRIVTRPASPSNIWQAGQTSVAQILVPEDYPCRGAIEHTHRKPLLRSGK
jgi:hypothetical protein